MTRKRFATAALATVACFALTGTAAAAPADAAGPSASAAKKKVKTKTYTVCKRGCKIRTLKAAVAKADKLNIGRPKSKRYRVTIKVRPGTYKEAVVVRGHHLDGIGIVGATKNARKVVFDGETLPTPGNGVNEVGIYGQDVDRMRVQNLTVKNYAYTGLKIEGFVRPCDGFLMDNLRAEYNRTYGLYSFNCKGGKMSDSVAFGQADAGYYVGSTPEQADPKWTILEDLDAHLNVLGYSGTNSKYVHIRDSAFYNNGAGIVPNTLTSQDYQRTAEGKITNNKIFWNNFNYYNGDWQGVTAPQLPQDLRSGRPNAGLVTCTDPAPACSPVDPKSVGRLSQSAFYPVGIGVVLFGGTGWTVSKNDIFGNNGVGVAVVSDVENSDNATSIENRVTDNKLGRSGADDNGFDLFYDYMGEGNCFQGNTAAGGVSLLNRSSSPSLTDGQLYATCTAGGSGDPFGYNAGQFANVIDTLITRSITQQCTFVNPPSHAAFSWNGKSYSPYEVTRAVDCTGITPLNGA